MSPLRNSPAILRTKDHLPSCERAWSKRSIRKLWFGIVLLLLICTGCTSQQQSSGPTPVRPSSISNATSGGDRASPAPRTELSTPASLISTAVGAKADWTTYVDSVGGYSVPVASTWTITSTGGGMVAFLDQSGNAGGEDGTIAGGVDILARYPGSNEYLDVLPNHSEPLDERAISSPAGTGRIFTLKRQYNNQIWVEQHAFIPVDNRFYDIWLKVGLQNSDTPAPQLARMVAGFRITGTFQTPTPLP